MAEQQLEVEDFYSSWERQFRGEEAPPSTFLHQLMNKRSSYDILTELRKEKESLETQKEQIEKNLSKVDFCLWWIDGKANRDSGVDSNCGDYETGDNIRSEKRDSFKEQGTSEGNELGAIRRPRRKRSQSLQPQALAEVREAVARFQFEQPRRGSFHGIPNNDYVNMSFKGPPRTPAPTQNGTRSNPPGKGLESYPGQKEVNPTEPAQDGEIYDRIMPTTDSTRRDFPEVVTYLCRELPTKEASAIAYGMDGTKVKVTADRVGLYPMVSRWITDGDLGRLLQLLDDHQLYDIRRTVENILHEDGTTVPPPLPSSPRPGRRPRGSGSLFDKFRPQSGGTLPRTPSSGGAEERRDTFRCGVRITADYVPAGVRDSLINGYRWLSIVRGQQMDVMGTHMHVTGELYIARSEDGEIGLVSPKQCEVLSGATPVLWATDWFVTDTNQYADRLRNAQIGAFYIRKSVSNPGDLTLIVNTGHSTPTKFGISINASTYTMMVAGKIAYTCQSIKELIAHYKSHSLPTDTKTTVCLTVSCKKIP